jgi:dTDP-4-dehydrorhamnose 3,5-epimerase
MRTKALAGEKVQVVADQIGRLTFAEDLAAATHALIGSSAPYGTYNVTNSGPAVSWFELARTIYIELGVDPGLVSGLSSDEYQRLFPNKAKRPKFSVLTTKKFTSNTGHSLPDWRISLQRYLDSFK